MSGGEASGGAAAEVAASAPSGGSAAHDKAIVHGVVWQGALRWLSQLLSWTATIVIARRLTAEDYGIAGTATVVMGMVLIATENGIGRALVMRRERDRTQQQQAHGASMLVGSIGAILMVLVAVPLSMFYGDPRIAPITAFLAFAPFLSGMNAVPVASLQQRLRYRTLAQVEFIKAVVQASVVLVSALFGARYWSLAMGVVAGQAAGVLVVRRSAHIAAAMPRMRDVRPILGYATHLVTATLAWYIYSNSDFAVVGKVVGIASLGLYQFAWNIAQLPGEKIANVLQSVVGPFFGAIGDDKASLRHYFLLLSELMVTVMLPILGGFALVSPIAVPLLFGWRWAPAVPIMQILVVSASLNSVATLGHHVLSATGQAKVGSRVNLIAMLVMPICFFVSGHLYGTVAVAAVWLAAQPALLLVPLMRVRTILDLSIRSYFSSLQAAVICTALMMLGVIAVRHLMSTASPLLQMCVLVPIGIALYVGAYLSFYRSRVQKFHDLVRSARAAAA